MWLKFIMFLLIEIVMFILINMLGNANLHGHIYLKNKNYYIYN